MLLFYALFACVHFTAKNPAPQAGRTRCVEREVLFQAEACKRELPKGDGYTEKNRHRLSWRECRETRADSWIPGDAGARGNRVYKAEAGVSDPNALAALLAPLDARDRATLGPGDFKRAFQKAFQGPGDLSFFVVGTGAKVIVFAVTHLDDFQFAQMAADVSSFSEGIAAGEHITPPKDMTVEKEELDFLTIAEDAGVKLSYHTESSQRAVPPPGGMTVEH